METETSKSPHPLMWVAGIALIVFCGAGVAAIMGWIPTSMGKPDEFPQSKAGQPAAVAAAPAPAPAKAAAAAPDHSARDAREARDAHEARLEREARNRAAPAAVVAARCAECGVVQSVREIDAKGTGSGLGAAGGAVVGGVLGHQVGHGDGTTIATVIGAVGGGLAGNEIEKRVKTTKSFEITVRMEDGSSRVFSEPSASTWRIGDKVKIVNGAIQSNA